MKKLLVLVDYQYDFVAPDGLLTCGEPALAIFPAVMNAVEEYMESNQNIVFTHDAHDPISWKDHPESAGFSIHCMKGTQGYELFGKRLQEIEANYPNALKVDKKAFCMDFQNLTRIVSEDYDIIEVGGVTTDICVLQNFIGLYTAIVDLGKKTKLGLRPKCCASFDASAHDFAVNYMTRMCAEA